MEMRVHQTRHDEMAGGVEGGRAGRSGEVRAHGGHEAVADEHVGAIPFPVVAAERENPSAGDQEVTAAHASPCPRAATAAISPARAGQMAARWAAICCNARLRCFRRKG